MVKEKIDMCEKELNKGVGKVKSYKVKYLDKYGFASCYFKVEGTGGFSVLPAVILPNSEEDAEDYEKFTKFLNDSWITHFFNFNGVLDEQSIVSILKFVEYERLKLSGKDALHKDLSDYNYIKSVRDVISDYIMPFSEEGNPRCIFSEETHKLVVVTDSDIDYFDEAREYLGI